MKEQPQFDSIYKELIPSLKIIEEKRIELKAQGAKSGATYGSIAFVIGTIIVCLIGINIIGIIISAAIGVFIFFSVIYSQSDKLSDFYKKDIISKIINSFCENATFNPRDGISETIFVESGLFSSLPDRYHTEDLITGCIDKTDFSCGEVHAEEKHVSTDSKGRTHEQWVDIFQGFIFIADFNKNFSGKTTINRNSFIKFHSEGKRIKLENIDFEKRFDVYSTDQIEARYILSPSMMERLVELDKKFKGNIIVSFRNSQVIIAIPDSINHFEASIWKTLMDPGFIAKEFSTIHSLINIINDLNLNIRIWTKQ